MVYRFYCIGVILLPDATSYDKPIYIYKTLTIESIPGTDLLDKLITEGDWTEAKAAEIVKNLLGILQILSSHNIQHMDIKVIVANWTLL